MCDNQVTPMRKLERILNSGWILSQPGMRKLYKFDNGSGITLCTGTDLVSIIDEAFNLTGGFGVDWDLVDSP